MGFEHDAFVELGEKIVRSNDENELKNEENHENGEEDLGSLEGRLCVGLHNYFEESI